MSEFKKCSSCGSTLVFSHEANFKVGGTSGGLKLLFGEWAELGENMIPMNIYVCPNCGKIEFFATNRVKEALLCNTQNP